VEQVELELLVLYQEAQLHMLAVAEQVLGTRLQQEEPAAEAQVVDKVPDQLAELIISAVAEEAVELLINLAQAEELEFVSLKGSFNNE
jgi:hypothetical protein